jgi:hypothetical protein
LHRLTVQPVFRLAVCFPPTSFPEALPFVTKSQGLHVGRTGKGRNSMVKF